jgi:hypothetical protein
MDHYPQHNHRCASNQNATDQQKHNTNNHDRIFLLSPLSNNNDRSGTTTTSTNRVYLSSDYVLNEYDVICGRGVTCYNHMGNIRLRQLVQQHVASYRKATNKYDKTLLLQSIIDQIRRITPTPGGGFVKKDKNTGRYYEVGDFLAVRSNPSLLIPSCLFLCAFY